MECGYYFQISVGTVARENQVQTLGYRYGVELTGKNSSLQEGFNLGYTKAAAPGFNFNDYRRWKSMILSMYEYQAQRNGTDDVDCSLGAWRYVMYASGLRRERYLMHCRLPVCL